MVASGSQKVSTEPSPYQKVVALVDGRLDAKLAATNQELGKQFGSTGRQIAELSGQLQTLRNENKELREQIARLRVEFSGIKRLADAAGDSAAAAKADTRVMERTIERVNVLAEIVDSFLKLFEPLYGWLSTLMEGRARLDRRAYSRSRVYGDKLPGEFPDSNKDGE
ncbi:MAG: hypothetical protein AAGF93_00515 [Cyanobacteria bacterium P01_H01_bin.105]